MRATVYFRTLPDAAREKVNRVGWDCPEGHAYNDARFGYFDGALRMGFYREAAKLDRPDAERVWVTLQNVVAAWRDTTDVECMTDFPRSMDVGDVIVWEDGRAEICASVGFEEANDFARKLAMEKAAA
jgi:hypothetical protein